MATQVQLPREAACWMKAESTVGTPVLPAATDALAIVGAATLNQQASYTDSEEVANSRSVLDQARDLVGAGEWSLSTYIRPSGSAGTAPCEALLWKGLLGSEAVVGATSVTYSPAIDLGSYTLVWRGSNVALYAIGATVNSLSLRSGTAGYVQCDWSGQFLQLAWAGESTLDGLHDGTGTPVSTVTVADGSQFAAGAFIQIGTDDNSSGGFRITAVSGNDLTITPSMTTSQADGLTVTYLLPAHTLSGTPAEARNSAVTWAGASTKFREFALEVTNNNEVLTEEVTTDDYPDDYVPGVRNVSGSLSIVMRTDDLDHYTRGLADATIAVTYANSDGAGKICTVSLPYLSPRVPEIGEAGPAVGLSVGYTALASSGEDEISVAFT